MDWSKEECAILNRVVDKPEKSRFGMYMDLSYFSMSVYTLLSIDLKGR